MKLEFLIIFLLILTSCSKVKKMQRVSKINKTEIDKLLFNKKVIKEDIAAHFLISELSDGNILALHFERNWGYLSNKRQTINEAVRKYMLQGRPDNLQQPLVKNARQIIRERKSKIHKLCDYLTISTNTDLNLDEIKVIDDKIRKKGSKIIYEKFYIELGLFLGEIIINRTKGKWYLHQNNDFGVLYEHPMIKTDNNMIYSPWGRIDRYYDKEVGEFSLQLAISGIVDSFEVYKQDFNEN